MKEIKFRYWDGKSIYVDETLAPGVEIFVEPEVLSIMQYTGLKDKNGEEIYEGDIIKAPAGTFKVVWRGCGFWIDNLYKEYDGGYLGGDDGRHMEVIGNIHQNPELLAVKLA